MNFVTQAQVTEVIEHKSDVREFVLSIQKSRKYTPGSFVQLSLDRVTASDIWPESRAFSIASYEKDSMRFIIKKVGNYTNRIFGELEVGKYCTVKYPFGELFKVNAMNEKHLFIASGLGITSYLGIIDYFKKHDMLENIALLYCAKYEEDILYFNKLKFLLGKKLEIFITQESVVKHHNRRIEIDDIKRNADEDTNIYICGSESFNSSLKKSLQLEGFNKIHMDEWE